MKILQMACLSDKEERELYRWSKSSRKTSDISLKLCSKRVRPKSNCHSCNFSERKRKDKSMDLTEDSEEAAIRSCHQEPTRRNKRKRQKKLVPFQVCDLNARGHANCLTIICSEKATKKKNKNSSLHHTCQACDYHTRSHPTASWYMG